MAPPFVQLTPAKFRAAVASFAWKPGKTHIHMHHTWRPNHAQYRGLPSINGMYQYHITHGFSDIAQHVTVAPDGTVWTGRPWNATPGSAKGHNHPGIFMFETVGDFDNERDQLEGAQRQTVITIITTLMTRFGLGPDALIFHNELSAKSCPGNTVSKKKLLAEVGQALASGDDATGEVDAEALDEEARAALGPEDPPDPGDEVAEHPVEGDTNYEEFIKRHGSDTEG